MSALAGALCSLTAVAGPAQGATVASCPSGIAVLPCADLVAGRLTATPIEDGRRLGLTLTVTNAGTAATPATTLQVTIGPHVLAAEPLQALAVKETAEIQLSESIGADVRGTGQAISITLDPEDKVAETNETNNVARTKAFLPALPDLTLAQSAARVENGDTIVLEVLAGNQGKADDTIPTTLTATGAGVTTSGPVPLLAAGDSQPITLRLLIPAQARVGPVSVSLSIDPADVVAEQDESNNTLTPSPLTIAPNLVLTRATPTRSGRTVTIDVEIRNTGNATAPATQLRGTRVGWQSEPRRIEPLSPGASVRASLSLVAPASAQGQDATITVTVDPVPGDIRDDNTREVAVGIPAPPATPDLYVASVDPARHGGALRLTVEIGNAGSAPARATLVRASAPGWTFAPATLDPLAAGASRRVLLQSTVPSSAQGQRVAFDVRVDPVDGDPSANNVKRLELQIPKPSAAPPDVAVSALGIRRDGQNVLVEAVVANVGSGAVGRVQLALHASGWPRRVRILHTLAAGRATAVAFVLSVPPSAAGTTASFTLSASPAPGELNLANNVSAAPFAVSSLSQHRRWWLYAIAAIGALLALSLCVAIPLRARRLRLRISWQQGAENERPETCEVPQAHVLQGEGKPKPAFRTIEKLGLAIRDDDGSERARTSVDGAIVETLNRALWAHRLRRRRRVRGLVEPLGEQLAAEIERWLADQGDVHVAISAEIKGGKLEHEFTRSECVRDGDACRWEERQKWKGEHEHKVEVRFAAVHLPLEPRADRIRQLGAELVELIGRVDVPRHVRAPDAVALPHD